MGYRARVLDAELATVMRSAGAVLIEGPKACGKTATATQVAKTVVRLDTDVAAQAAIAIDPALLLDGPAPILLDEWQVAPAIWNAVRRAVDDRTERGQFARPLRRVTTSPQPRTVATPNTSGLDHTAGVVGAATSILRDRSPTALLLDPCPSSPNDPRRSAWLR